MKYVISKSKIPNEYVNTIKPNTTYKVLSKLNIDMDVNVDVKPYYILIENRSIHLGFSIISMDAFLSTEEVRKFKINKII